MKLSLKYAIIILVIISIFWLTSKIYTSYNKKLSIEKQIQILPHYCFKSLNDSTNTICIDEYDANQPTIILYYHPECEHCQYEIKEIRSHALEFSSTNLILISPDDSIERIRNFAMKNSLYDVNNLELLLDSNHKFDQYFGSSIIPSVFIYRDNKLINKYLGETKIENILNSINNN